MRSREEMSWLGTHADRCMVGDEIRLMDDTVYGGLSGGRFVPCPSPFRGIAFSILVRTDRMGRAFSPLGSLFRHAWASPAARPPSSPVYLQSSKDRPCKFHSVVVSLAVSPAEQEGGHGFCLCARVFRAID